MAIAAWLVWRTLDIGPQGGFRPSGLVFFAVQLFLNALWAAILVTTLRFWKAERFAAGLMIPYLLWITFACALNFEIRRLN